MRYTTRGKTGLLVSMAGCSGFSRIGLPAGKAEGQTDQLVRKIKEQNPAELFRYPFL